MKKIKEKLLLIYLIINLLYIIICSFLALNQFIGTRIFSYGYIVLLIINAIIILILFFKKKYIKNKIDIFLLLIIIFAIISTIFAYDTKKALFGELGRFEGLFIICYYMTIVFITSLIKKEDRKKIIYFILFIGFIECTYALMQKLDLFNVKIKYDNGYRCATGFTSNRVFFGTLMTLCDCYAIGLYFNEKSKINILLFLAFSYLFTIGLLLSKSTACLLSIIVIMILLFIYSIKNKKIKKYILLSIVLLFTFFFIESTHFSTFMKDINVTKNEVREISKGNADDDFGSRRIILWKETIKIVPKYLIHGVGIDNFSNVLNGKPIKSSRGFFDKAHNEYLQILVTMGIFSLISYLCLHFLILKEGIKETIKNKEIYYILPVIGYLIQAQFNISVIEVAPLFYIALGLVINRE